MNNTITPTDPKNSGENRYTSDELWHFVGRNDPEDHKANYGILRTILNSGWITHPPHEDKSEDPFKIDTAKTLTKEELIVPSITCYCDIPRECLNIHMSKYGQFGVSFDRQFLVTKGTRPVTYIPYYHNDYLSIHGRQFLRDLEQIYRGFNEVFTNPNSSSRMLGQKPLTPEDTVKALDSLIVHYFAFLKPFNSELAHIDPDSYYMEREWRKIGNLEFRSDDIQSIIVAPEYLSCFKKDFPKYQELVICM